jgi:hypothetical protein
MTDGKREEIGRLLMAAVCVANNDCVDANADFSRVADDVPRIQGAGSESGLALEGCLRALKRYTEFVLHGVVPEDLFESL